MIRICQEDVVKYGEDWLQEVLLPVLLQEQKEHVYISTKTDLYDTHKELYSRAEM